MNGSVFELGSLPAAGVLDAVVAVGAVVVGAWLETAGAGAVDVLDELEWLLFWFDKGSMYCWSPAEGEPLASAATGAMSATAARTVR